MDARRWFRLSLLLLTLVVPLSIPYGCVKVDVDTRFRDHGGDGGDAEGLRIQIDDDDLDIRILTSDPS